MLIPYEQFLQYDFDTAQQTHHAAALFYAERYCARHPVAPPAGK
ncbi:MAG: hypothetical protein RLN72_03680 [Henriciella sp.]